MALHSDDGIDLWVKVGLSAEGLYTNGVFLEGFRRAGNRFCGQELEELLECSGIPEGGRLQNSADLVITLLNSRSVPLRGCRSVCVCQASSSLPFPW